MTTPGFTPSSPPPSATGGKILPIGMSPGEKPVLGAPDAIPNPLAVAGQITGDAVAPYMRPETTYETTPNPNAYMPGDQYSLPYKDQESIPQLQAELVQAGLLNPKQVRLGQWDAVSAAAFAKVLGFANHYALNARQALDVFKNNPKLGKSTTQPTVAFTNPQDVQTGFQNVSQNMTGQEMPTGDFQSFYHSQEAAQAHSRGQNYTQAPSVTGAATQYLINNDPSQVQAYGTASRMQELYSMLGIRG